MMAERSFSNSQLSGWRYAAVGPRVLTGDIKARAGYGYSHHRKAGNPSTQFVPDDVVDRFCLLGAV